jgi:T-complex protein 1 subunit beta
MRTLGVTESYKLKKQVVLSASEAAEMIIRYVVSSLPLSFLGLVLDIGVLIRVCRVDDILRAAPRQREAV